MLDPSIPKPFQAICSLLGWEFKVKDGFWINITRIYYFSSSQSHVNPISPGGSHGAQPGTTAARPPAGAAQSPHGFHAARGAKRRHLRQDQDHDHGPRDSSRVYDPVLATCTSSYLCLPLLVFALRDCYFLFGGGASREANTRMFRMGHGMDVTIQEHI